MRAAKLYLMSMDQTDSTPPQAHQPAPDDLTLDEARSALAPHLPMNAAFDGWTPEAVEMAAGSAGIDPDIAKLAFKGGAMDMIDAWIEWTDAEMARRLPPEDFDAMKIRDKIRSMIETRLDIAAPDKEALRRAMAVQAMPQNLPRTAKIAWRSADRMWRMAGDTATDYNHYTKRMTLTAVYGSTLTVFLNDDSEDFADTRAFLSRRIDNVMQFEKAKAQWTGKGAGGSREGLSLSRFIGRLRYPAR